MSEALRVSGIKRLSAGLLPWYGMLWVIMLWWSGQESIVPGHVQLPLNHHIASSMRWPMTTLVATKMAIAAVAATTTSR